MRIFQSPITRYRNKNKENNFFFLAFPSSSYTSNMVVVYVKIMITKPRPIYPSSL